MSKEFEHLLSTETKHLKSFSLTLCRDPTLADDLIQQTLMKAWKARDNFEIGTNFKGWVSTIMMNEYRTHRRKKSTQKEIVSLSVSDGDDDSEKVVQYDLPIQPRQENTALIKQLYGLTFKMIHSEFGECIRALVFEQQSYDEYAAENDLPIGTVKSRFHRAVREFNSLFNADVYRPVRV
ncbi:RNA polymerase sigma factor [Rhizobium phage RL2RES]|uniref:RNA polymerase sigma factor n=1 Tax=Rhizobium phage RL2RES TaxID=103371 RepID=A0A6B9J3Z7_9CAUD|nr:RNA polymerase sigma factor [Rhizobium phage RL2RES]QGZ14178.1 RNA polymerase sigma factor [Rhizobium phage RL2RES]